MQSTAVFPAVAMRSSASLGRASKIESMLFGVISIPFVSAFSVTQYTCSLTGQRRATRRRPSSFDPIAIADGSPCYRFFGAQGFFAAHGFFAAAHGFFAAHGFE
ncbi:MAG: hypothetical protein WED13_07680, partial [Methyloceanibacter sp.]